MRIILCAAALIVGACGFMYAGQEARATMTPRSSDTPTALAEPSAVAIYPEPKTTIVTAVIGVRLRTRPDAQGPTDSLTLAIMEPGDAFLVDSCALHAGDWWAHGRYLDLEGWVRADFLTPNPCGAQ